MHPTPERFRRLARSAPWRWQALVLEGTWGPHVEPALVLLAQPDVLRVERLDGSVQHEGRHGSLSRGAVLTSDGRPVPCPPPAPPTPELDEDGLVTTARQPWHEGPDVPMWQDYRFVAVLDPYELSAGVEVVSVRAVQHGGRPAWEAVVRTTPGYEPRCACCPLLRSRECDLAEGLAPLPAYAPAHRVRLDIGTGVCVLARELGGPSDGLGHELVVVRAV